MSADASIGPNIGWFEGGEQEVAGEDEVRLADTLLLDRTTHAAPSAIWSKTTGEFADRLSSMPKYVASRPWSSCSSGTRRSSRATSSRRYAAQAHHTGTLLSYGCGEFAINPVKHRLSRRCIFWFPIVWSEPSRPLRRTGLDLSKSLRLVQLWV
jgi:hypothetical protein